MVLRRRRNAEFAIVGFRQDLAALTRELDRVIAQRDELRRVIGNVRSYARQEAQEALKGHVHFPDELTAAATVDKGRVKMRPTVALAAHLKDPEPPEQSDMSGA